MSVTVFGAGAFGTALAIALAGHREVTLVTRSEPHANRMRATRENSERLPGIALPEALRIVSFSEPVPQSSLSLLAVPMQQLRGFLGTLEADVFDTPMVACCKGIELETGLGPTAVIEAIGHNPSPAVLTGPSFAQDIAQGLPTALTLACPDPALGEMLQAELSTSALRIYRTTDVTGAEMGGALKNVIAIACGAAMGAGLGESARAALMTRGFAEMSRLALKFGAEAETLAGLSGFGDLVLTCTSDKSRNYRLGQAIGQGQKFDPNITVEGAATALAVADLANRENIDMPITQTVAALLKDRLTIREAMAGLLSRPLKEE